MKQYIGCDAHKKYSVFVAMDEAGHMERAHRVEHTRQSLGVYLETLPARSPIAVETMGYWYWLVDQIEAAGHQALLVHARKAKLMMGQVNKTDKLDARGLALLLRNGTLPTVWIPPGELRDQRELPRLRMVLVRTRTMLKNRIHAHLAKYAVRIEGVSDVFGVRGRELLQQRLGQLPPETQRSVQTELTLLDEVGKHIGQAEQRIEAVIERTPEMQRLRSLPGVGPILSVVIALEIGSVDRFASSAHLASYSGLVPRIHESGGRGYYGRVRSDVNRYLKWAFIEAANVVVLSQDRMLYRHVVKLYRRLRERRGHAKAVVAVGRHLAEAAYWMLKKQEVYREPRRSQTVSSTPRQARGRHESLRLDP
jgi:transposase